MFINPANCAGTETEEWFSDTTVYENKPILKKICNSCLAKDECLDYALHHNVQGFWGGTSEFERKMMRRALGIIPEPVLISEWEMAKHYA